MPERSKGELQVMTKHLLRRSGSIEATLHYTTNFYRAVRHASETRSESLNLSQRSISGDAPLFMALHLSETRSEYR
ncbi:hypothetical protein AC578_1444 [Pseudocercospora eumusae]|uniref:Uncharacterized protein n=1 Tax=Pseudocercospora eumusae TaxID=321146 RepID=A0A139GTK6_9PEZI|nr:hypothetical protein AC578_1444 [Pseudocercospora eumusae]